MLKTDDDGSASVQLARLDDRAGRPDDAVRRLNTVLQQRPTQAAAHLLKARILHDMGNPDDRFARAAVAADGRSSEARLLLGEILDDSGDHDGAIEQYEEAVRRAPSDPQPRIALSRALLEMGRTSQAVLTSKEAVRLGPGNKDARLTLVMSLIADGDHDDAAVQLADVTARFPDAADVVVQQGRLALALGNTAAARTHFLRALSLQPHSHEALTGIVDIELKSQPTAFTLALVQSAIAAQPAQPELRLLAGRLLAAMKEPGRAEDVLRQALVLDSSSPEIALALAKVLRDSGRADEAIQVLKQVVARRPPQMIELQSALASLYESVGRMDDARQQHEVIVVEDPDAADSSYWLASHYVDDPDKLNGALELAMAAKRGRPRDPDVNALLGRIYAAKGLSSLAVASLKEAIDANPRQALYHFYLAGAYERGGNLSQARDEYAAALRIDQSFPGADRARQMAGNRR